MMIFPKAPLLSTGIVFAEMHIEDFLIQSLVDNKYTLSITNIKIEREEQGYYTVSFLVNTVYGQYNENTQIEAII